MSKTSVTVFLCTGKDCRKAWRRVGDDSPGKWLKRQVEEAGLPYKLHIVKTECMDRCEHAASVCCVHGACAVRQEDIRSTDDADHFLAALRCCVEAKVPEYHDHDGERPA
jgi:predicted metal-binding protein